MANPFDQFDNIQPPVNQAPVQAPLSQQPAIQEPTGQAEQNQFDQFDTPGQSAPVNNMAPARQPDIVDQVSGVGSKISKYFEKRKENVTGAVDRLSEGSVAQGIFRAPEIALETAGQAAGFAADVAGDVVGPVAKAAYQAAVPRNYKDVIEGTMAEIPNTAVVKSITPVAAKVAKEYGKFAEKYPDLALQIEGVVNIGSFVAGLTGLKATASGAKSAAVGTKNLMKEGADIVSDLKTISRNAKKVDREVQNIVNTAYDKAIRPAVKGKKKFPGREKARVLAKDSVEEIVNRQESLSFVDDVGNTVTGKLPENLNEWHQAINQVKKEVYNEYHTLAVRAGEKGASFNAKPIVEALQQESVNLGHTPEVRNYASKLIDEIAELDGAAPEIVEKRIAQYNESLRGFFSSGVPQAKSQVHGSVANLMRKELDKNIEDSIGAGYQALKKKYGSLASIEDEVGHRAIISARQNVKGLADMTDIFTEGEMIAGLAGMLAGSPSGGVGFLRGLVGKTVKKGIKSANDPNEIVKKMFSRVSKQKKIKSRTVKNTLKNIEDLKAAKKKAEQFSENPIPGVRIDSGKEVP